MNIFKAMNFPYGWWFKIFAFLKAYLIGAVYLWKELCKKKFRRQQLHVLNELPLRPGCVAIVTGGTEGIGLQTVYQLISKGMQVIIGANLSPEECVQRKILMEQKYPLSKVDICPLDLASMSSVKKFAQNFLNRCLDLHLLVNNAGIMYAPFSITIDGFEKHLAVNYLSHCLLTRLLLPKMAESGRGDLHGRIVFVSSAVHYVGCINFSDLHGKKVYSRYHAYLQSKLAIVLMTYQLQKFVETNSYHVTVNCLHPGVVNTQLYKYVWWAPAIGPYLFKTPSEGSETVLYASLAKEMEGIGGKYLEECSFVRSSQISYDVSLQTRLWNLTWDLLEKWL